MNTDIEISRPSPINNLYKVDKINNDSLINERYIENKIDYFEKTLDGAISQIDKVATNWSGKKEDWDNIYLPQLSKINNDMISFIKLLNYHNVKIENVNNNQKLDAIINKCFSIMLIGDKYFPN
jgi:hypothetical protein